MSLSVLPVALRELIYSSNLEEGVGSGGVEVVVSVLRMF